MKPNSCLYAFAIVLHISLGISNRTKSQNFEIIVETENNCRIVDSKEDILGNIICCGGERAYLDPLHNAFAMKILPSGNTIFKSFNHSNDTSSGFSQVLTLPSDSTYLFFGSIGKKDSLVPQRLTDYLWVVKLDENLNKIWEKRYKVAGTYANPFYKIWMCDNDVIYAAGDLDWWNGYHRVNFFMARFNTEGDTIMTRYPFIDDPMQFPLGSVDGGCMGRHFGQEGMMVVGDNFDLMGNPGMVEIDSNLNYTFTPFTGNVSLSVMSSVKHLSNHTYLFSSSGHIGDEHEMIVGRFNKNHLLLEKTFFGRPDTIDFPAAFKSMDFTGVNNIFAISRDNAFPESPMNTSVGVALMDSSMNLKGLKYYGKDRNYYSSVVTATADGGCVIAGNIYDWQNNPPDDVNIWIKKVYPDDLITYAEETADDSDSDVLIFPNPGKEIINLKTIRTNLVFLLRSADGVRVLKKNVAAQDVNQWNIDFLPSGTYIYSIKDLNKNKMIETGKWIKQ